MKIHFVEKKSEGDTEAQLEAMRKRGFEFVPPNDAKLIYCASIAAMRDTQKIMALTGLPLAVYCWDYYIWAHNGSNMSGNWIEYAEMLQDAAIVFVPSEAQQKRLKELLGVKSVVVHTGVSVYEHKTADKGYILDPVRYYPEENEHWAEQAASQLGIRLIHSEHGYSEEEFRKLVAECRFLTCAYREASTGGLSLVQGLWLGKPALVSNSPYMGAKDYLGDFGNYFQYDSFESLVRTMESMWFDPPEIDLFGARQHIKKDLSYDQMADKLYELCETVKIS